MSTPHIIWYQFILFYYTSRQQKSNPRRWLQILILSLPTQKHRVFRRCFRNSPDGTIFEPWGGRNCLNFRKFHWNRWGNCLKYNTSWCAIRMGKPTTSKLSLPPKNFIPPHPDFFCSVLPSTLRARQQEFVGARALNKVREIEYCYLPNNFLKNEIIVSRSSLIKLLFCWWGTSEFGTRVDCCNVSEVSIPGDAADFVSCVFPEKILTSPYSKSLITIL